MYKLVGVDNREYGPVTQEAVLEWIAQGRANGSTIARFEEGAWKPLQTFPEFRAALGVSSAPTQGAPASIVTTWATGEAPPYSGLASQPRKTNIPAILGLVFSIVCCCCGYLGPILGLILSVIGYAQIRAKPDLYSTSPAIPIAGICISIILILLSWFLSSIGNDLSAQMRQIISNLPK
jgi:hypothetical protein